MLHHQQFPSGLTGLHLGTVKQDCLCNTAGGGPLPDTGGGLALWGHAQAKDDMGWGVVGHD